MSVNGCTSAPIECPKCESTSYRKSGRQKGRQRYLCKDCGKTFLEPIPANMLPTSEVVAMPPATPELEGEEKPITVKPDLLPVPQTNDLESEIVKGELPIHAVYSAKENGQLPLSDLPPVREILSQGADSPTPPPLQDIGLAILLLDVENLKIDLKAEQFLADLCSYPLQVKIAFANWRNPSLNNQDLELHKRGYQLIHVPSGPSNADGKMIAVGSSIFLHYPTAKEVLVCSSDTLLIHLCNELQSQGLRVYRVWRQEKNLAFETYHTGETKYYSLAIGSEIPDFQDLMNQLKEWVFKEQTSMAERLADLAVFSTLFQARLQIEGNGDRSPNPLEFTTEVAPFDPVLAHQEIGQTLPEVFAAYQGLAVKICSRHELEEALRESLKELEVKVEKDQILVGDLGVAFTQKYGKSASSILKELKISGTLTEFLKSCSGFKVTGTHGKFRVAIA